MIEKEKQIRNEIEAKLNNSKPFTPNIVSKNKQIAIKETTRILRQPKKPRSGNKDIHSLSNDYLELSYVAKKFNIPVSFVMRVKEDLDTYSRVKIYIEIKNRLNNADRLVWDREKWKIITPFTY